MEISGNSREMDCRTEIVLPNPICCHRQFRPLSCFYSLPQEPSSCKGKLENSQENDKLCRRYRNHTICTAEFGGLWGNRGADRMKRKYRGLFLKSLYLQLDLQGFRERTLQSFGQDSPKQSLYSADCRKAKASGIQENLRQ